MNLVKSENPFIVEAKICGCCNNKKSVSYHYIESGYNLCLDNMEIIFSQLQACEKLLEFVKDEAEISTIKREIVDLHLGFVANNIPKIRENEYCTSCGCNKKAIICCTLCSDYLCYNHLQGHGHSMDNFEVRP
ncbi:MAG: hypothetical protein P0116_02675 [Candidatus Nitrosocosmicus sp.]|nr:hypothetical protein [Candidatus Nitrosocosmicus sp.]